MDKASISSVLHRNYQFIEYSPFLDAQLNHLIIIILTPTQLRNIGCQEISDAVTNCKVCLDFIWERLNSGHWTSVPIHWREAYSVFSYTLAVCHWCAGNSVLALKTVDYGLIMGGELPGGGLSVFGECLHHEVFQLQGCSISDVS